MGWVYVLQNDSMPGLLKIGMTTRKDLSKRVKELSSSTSVPLAFKVIYRYETKNARKKESEVFKRLAKYRVNDKREFFRCSLMKAKAAINSKTRAETLTLQLTALFIILGLWMIFLHSYYREA